jgi:hypothetical protein
MNRSIQKRGRDPHRVDEDPEMQETCLPPSRRYKGELLFPP